MKGVNFASLGPQFMANMMANADLMNMKQNMYPNYMPNMQQPPIVITKKNSPIYNLTEVFLKK